MNDWTTKPICCPYCAGKKILELQDWNAVSEEEEHNSATLTEYQCETDCQGRSFWA